MDNTHKEVHTCDEKNRVDNQSKKMTITCPRCNYTWRTTSQRIVVTCSNCHTSIRRANPIEVPTEKEAKLLVKGEQ